MTSSTDGDGGAGPRLTVALTFDHDAISDGIRRGDPPVKISHGSSGRGSARRGSSLLASRGDPVDLVRAGPHARGVSGVGRGDRRGRPRARVARLVPRGLRGALRGRAARRPGPERRGVDDGAWRNPPTGLAGAVLGARAADARARRGGRVPLRLVADGRRLPALPGPPRRPPLRRRGHALGPRGLPGRGAGLLGDRRLAPLRARPGAGRDGLAAPSKVLEIWTAELRYAWEHAPGRPLHGHDAPRVHRPRPPDGDARAVHRRGGGPRRRRLRAPRHDRRAALGRRRRRSGELDRPRQHRLEHRPASACR